MNTLKTIGRNAVLCKEIVFDILEYPAQETTDPDPVMARVQLTAYGIGWRTLLLVLRFDK